MAGAGDKRGLDEALPAVYAELRRLAAHYLDQERPGHTLQPTALVHEAYLRLSEQRSADWTNRAQFFGLAAQMMRRILVNHARDRATAKRGDGAAPVSLSLAAGVSGESARSPVDVIALHVALERLEALDARVARVVELKYFAGLSTAEAAEVLDVSTATAERDWTFARAWLYDAIEGADDDRERRP